MKTGELFAGVGGLGMAVDEVFNSTPAWFCEFDKAPSKVLAHHHPDIPNYGDVTKVDWKTTPRVNILAGGFPCQDVSLAGRRKGMGEGTRSGLWSEYAKAINELRPDWVVIENVRGLLSADAAGNVEQCPWCLGENNEQHALRALGAVLGDLADLGFDAEWTGIRASDVGAPHGRFRVFILAWPKERTAQDAGSGRGWWGAVTPGCGEGARADAETNGPDTRDDRPPEAASVTLLPTPAAMNPNDGEGTETWLARRERVKKTAKNGNGMGMPLAIAVQLLPTPVAQPSGNTPEDHLRKKPGREIITDLAIIAENGLIETGGRLHASSEGRPGEVLPGVRDAACQEAVRQRTPRGSGSVPPEVSLLEAMRGDEERRTAGHAPLAGEPGSVEGSVRSVSSDDRSAHSSSRSGRDEQRSGEPSGALQVVSSEAPLAGGPDVPSRAGSGTAWGPYRAAIERWERVLGRPAPAPVLHNGKNGKPRLNPALCEWMMGWPAGHVTDPAIGLSRAEQLKACGNGVVPQQAAAALREMLTRPGVPAVTA